MNRFFNASWSDPTLTERNEVVFINRFKEYGAYEIRSSYEKTAAFALLLTITLIVLLFSTPLLIHKFSEADYSTPVQPFELSVDLMDIPPAVTQIIPDQPLPESFIEKTIRSLEFKTPVVVNDIIDNANPPTQDVLHTVNPGVETVNGPESLPPPAIEIITPDVSVRPVTIVEEMPVFKEGEAAMYQYLHDRIKYPGSAIEHNITGKVYVNFIVDKTGKITDVKLLRGIGYGCDEEALRVIRSMPDWKPGRQNGQPVAVSFNMPVEFILK